MLSRLRRIGDAGRLRSLWGMMVNALGWGLALRSAVGVLLAALPVLPAAPRPRRIRAEERLPLCCAALCCAALRWQFGGEYDDDHCRRTRRRRRLPGLF